jgi:hypothetical protein
MRRFVFGLALALGLSAWSGGAMAEKYLIDHEVWGWYQQYLRNIGNGNRPGAFVITKDGHGAFYSWCQDTRCVAGPTYSQDALNYCEREYDTECVVFAVRDTIRVEYEIRGGASGGSSGASDAPALAPAEVTTVAVTPAVKSDIDAYLRNAASIAGRVWALAITKDGSSVESASCDAVGGGGYFGGGGDCDHTKGDIQGLASKKAVKDCGGPADCILLYVGKKKVANIEIVAAVGSAGAASAPDDSAPAPAVPVATIASTAKPAEAVTPPAPAPTPVLQPKPVTRIGIAPDIRSEIDAYLHNAESTARAWAFAIAKDGSAGAAASCPAGGGWSGGGACEPVKGGAQELASREAVKRCGGADDCILLYVGQKKATDIELVAR